MKTIGEDRGTQETTNLVKRFEQPDEEKPSEDRADSPYQYWMEKTRKALGEPNDDRDEYSFGQLAGLTSGWSVQKIKRRYHKCRKADIPFAPLWWHLYNKDNE